MYLQPRARIPTAQQSTDVAFLLGEQIHPHKFLFSPDQAPRKSILDEESPFISQDDSPSPQSYRGIDPRDGVETAPQRQGGLSSNYVASHDMARYIPHSFVAEAQQAAGHAH